MSDRKATIALDDEGDLNTVDVLVAIEKQPTSEWILDLVIPLTCVLIRIFFKTFESIDGGKVLLGNNVTCETNGVGTIIFKMFDSVIKDLNQVRYMLDLKINLISLEMIDQLGCSIKASNGQIQVIDKGVVIMKGVRRNVLYVIVGSSSLLGVTTSVSCDKTKL